MASGKMGSHKQSFSENDSSADSDTSLNTARAMRWSKFVRNVYEMAMSPENAQAIGFSSDGLCLEIRDAKTLSNEVLQKYFKHRNVTSFIRQLNNYGFKTIPVLLNSDVVHCFAHDNFRRGRLDLLEGVTRRGTANDESQKIGEQLESLKQKSSDLEHRLHSLRASNDQLLRQNQELAEENKRLKASWSVMQDTIIRGHSANSNSLRHQDSFNGRNSNGIMHQHQPPPPPPPPPNMDQMNFPTSNGSSHHPQGYQNNVDYSAPVSQDMFLPGLPLFSDEL